MSQYGGLEVDEPMEDLPEDEGMDDLDLGLEEALQETFTSQPTTTATEEKVVNEGTTVMCNCNINIANAASTEIAMNQDVINVNDVDHSDDHSDQGLQNAGVQEAIDSLDEATKVIPEESVDAADTRGVIVGDIKPLLPEQLDKIANCLVELKSVLDTTSATIVSVKLCCHGYTYCLIIRSSLR